MMSENNIGFLKEDRGNLKPREKIDEFGSFGKKITKETLPENSKHLKSVFIANLDSWREGLDIVEENGGKENIYEINNGDYIELYKKLNK